MHGLETIANIGQRTADDDRHGVVKIRPAHLVLYINREHDGGSAALDGVSSIGGRAGWRRVIGICVLWRRHFRVGRVVRKKIVSHGYIYDKCLIR